MKVTWKSFYRCTWRHLERNGARQANEARSIRNEISLELLRPVVAALYNVKDIACTYCVITAHHSVCQLRIFSLSIRLKYKNHPTMFQEQNFIVISNWRARISKFAFYNVIPKFI